MVAQAAVRSGGSIFQTNQILATLSETTQAILEKKLEPITLRKGQALYRPYERIEKLYLPVTALVATFVRPIDGMTVGYSITGRDGITGINAALGVDHSPHSVDVISTGESVAIPLAYFQECIKLHSDLKERVLEYADKLLLRAQQNVVCNALHQVRERLAGLLILTQQQMSVSTLTLTHEGLSQLLGVRRACVTVTLKTLSRMGLIQCNRGITKITDIDGLRTIACECVKVIEKESSPLSIEESSAVG